MSSPAENPVGHSPPPPPATPAYAWVLAWLMLGVILTLIDRTRFGHTAIYYVLLLLIFFVLVSNYRFLTITLAPFSTMAQGAQA